MSLKLPKENYIACLLGGAIGDALGAPIEFYSIRQIKERYGALGVSGYIEFANGYGEFTDDTQMTLFTAEGLLRSWHRSILKGIGGATNDIVYDSYLRWLYTQDICMKDGLKNKGLLGVENGWLIKQTGLYQQRAPGNTCLSALQSGIAGTTINPINNSKGCGGIMRVAPVGLVFEGQTELSFTTGCDLAAITHGHPSGYLSAGFFAALISELAVFVSLEDAITHCIEILKQWNGNDETIAAVEKAMNLYDKTKSITQSQPEKIPELIETLGSGWIGEEALSISLYCSLLYQNDFAKGVLAAVNHSGDSDSTGSITGNILGLIYGLDNIPEKWISNLKNHEIIITIGEDLHIGIKGDSINSDKDWWDKYPGF
jgi:ADP-ribosylglycohydrolase